MERTILCIGPHCWGTGNSKKQANAKARRYKPTFVIKPCYVYYDAPGDVYVNEMGGIECPTGGELKPLPSRNCKATSHA